MDDNYSELGLAMMGAPRPRRAEVRWRNIGCGAAERPGWVQLGSAPGVIIKLWNWMRNGDRNEVCETQM